MHTPERSMSRRRPSESPARSLPRPHQRRHDEFSTMSARYGFLSCRWLRRSGDVYGASDRLRHHDRLAARFIATGGKAILERKEGLLDQVPDDDRRNGR